MPLVNTKSNLCLSQVFFLILCLVLAAEQVFTSSIENTNKYQPTADEIELGVAVQTLRCYGQLVQESKSLRILALGGSNTARIKEQGGWGHVLDDVLRAAALPVVSTIEVFVGGIGGCDPSCFYGEHTVTFPFEPKPIDQWPNVVILEFAVNCMPKWACTQNLNNLVQSLKERWAAVGLPPPGFMLLELFKLEWAVRSYDLSLEDKLQLLSAASDFSAFPITGLQFNKGTGGGVYLNAFARFHAYPLISLADALYPAFTRYFLDHNSTVCSGRCIFPFFDEDGGHISPLGAEFLAKELFVPFFRRVINTVSSDPRKTHCHLYDKEVHMFPPQAGHGKVLMSWWAFGRTGPGEYVNRLAFIAVNSTEWSFMKPAKEHDDPHRWCYGSTVQGSTARFHFVAHAPKCSHPHKCTIHVHYLSSWNTSLIGDGSCELYRIRSDHTTRKPIGQPMALPGNVIDGQAVYGTVLQAAPNISNILPHPGEYVVECTNHSGQGRLVCIGGINLNWQE